jgi:carbamoyltransferase
MLVLGFNWPSFHDNAVAAILDGRLVYASEEERYTRHKHAPYELPINAMAHCLKFLERKYGMKPDTIDAFAINFDPKFYSAKSRAWHSFSQNALIKDWMLRSDAGYDAYSFMLKGMRGSIASGFDFTKSAKEFVRMAALSIGRSINKEVKIIPVRHHLAHAASAYYFSGKSSATCIVVDGQGETDATTAWSIKDGEFEELLRVGWKEGSLGYLYESVSKRLGFGRLEGPGKVMGLAPYGKIDVKALGRLESLFDLEVGDAPYRIKKIAKAQSHDLMYDKIAEVFTGAKRGASPGPGEFPGKKAADTARTLQVFFERLYSGVAEWTANNSGMNDIVIAGGSALNAKANMEMHYSKKFRSVFVFPAAGDAGTAIGAAAYAYENVIGEKMRRERIKDLYLGDGYDAEQVKAAVAASNLKAEMIGEEMGQIAELLRVSKVIGFYQGRQEFGPRALGNRSIIGNPTSKKNWKRINSIKGREAWRPLAPSVLASSMNEYFADAEEHEFMVMMYMAKSEAAKRIPAVVHIDGTARPQAVRADRNKLWHGLIKEFGEASGENVIVNTSFNIAGEPIVDTPVQAIRSFAASGLDALYLDGWLISKH